MNPGVQTPGLFVSDLVLEVQQTCAAVDCHKGRGEHQRHNGHQLNKNVDRRARGVLKGIAYGVANHGSLMGFRAFAAVFQTLNLFFGIVPGTAAIGHKDCHHNAADQRTCQQTAQALNAQ